MGGKRGVIKRERRWFNVPEDLYNMVVELTPPQHTFVSTLFDAVNLLKEKRGI